MLSVKTIKDLFDSIGLSFEVSEDYEGNVCAGGFIVKKTSKGYTIYENGKFKRFTPEEGLCVLHLLDEIHNRQFKIITEKINSILPERKEGLG